MESLLHNFAAAILLLWVNCLYLSFDVVLVRFIMFLVCRARFLLYFLALCLGLVVRVVYLTCIVIKFNLLELVLD